VSGKTYDVVIVGASCAGLYAAQLLAESGRRVAVLERQSDLGQISRTWIVTEELNRILTPESSQTIVHRVDVMEMFSRSHVNHVQLQTPDLIVERALMQPLLAERARKAGAEIILGCRVQQMTVNAIGVELEVVTDRPSGINRVNAKTLIGADGVGSMVAKTMGAHPQVAVPIVQARVRLPVGYDPRHVRIWFDRQRSNFFYWLIPESSDYGVAGLVADSPTQARRLLDEFLVHQRLLPVSYQGAMIPLHQPLRRLEWRRGAARVLLVGDAAAHVKVTTVGGLVSGLWGAKAASQSIINGKPYFIEAFALNRELYLHDLIRGLLDRFDDEAYNRLLIALNPSLKQILSQRNRDSMARAATGLVAAQPSLMFLAVRAVFGLSYPSGLTSKPVERVEALTTE
jgi:digeranylgeranylglycerophospholipid reductase